MTVSILENELCRFPPVCVTDESGNRTIRKLMISYDEFDSVQQIKTILRGYSTLGESQEIVRYLPYKDPDDNLQVVSRLEHTGYVYRGRYLAVEDTLPFYTAFKPEKWIFTVMFNSIPYYLGDGEHMENGQILGATPQEEDGGETTRYATKDPRPEREFINPPKGTFYIGSTQINIPIPTVIPSASIETTWFQVPQVAYPKTAVAECLGKVNSAELKLPSIPDGQQTYAAGTVHLLGVRPQLVYQANGSYAVNISYAFRERKLGWNTFPRSDGSFAAVTRGAGGTEGIFKVTDKMKYLFWTEQAYGG